MDRTELRRLLDAATKGEWEYDGRHNEITTPHGDQYWLIISECRSAPDQEFRDSFGHGFDANFALIAAAHNALPALLDQLDAVEAEIADLNAERNMPLMVLVDGKPEPLADRDARMKSIGAAEWLERHAGDTWTTQGQGDMMRQIAAQLLKGGE